MPGTLLVVPDRRADPWRRALSGLTPRLVATVATLLLIRVVSGNIGGLVNESLESSLEYSLAVFVALSVMCVPMLLIIIATANLGPQRGWQRIAALAAAVGVSAAVGLLLRFGVDVHLAGRERWFDLYALQYLWPRYAFLGALLTAVGEFYRREVASNEAAQQAELDRAAAERNMAEARLQVLQAQIEPHFLFNTLANVRRLYEQDRVGGRSMLENLMRYLQVALPRMRESESTLGRDAELVEAFLRIQQIRMGRRLAFSVDIPAQLRAHPVPPMMVLTLVENAIKHGLNPSESGGSIRVTASREAAQLAVSVADTGVGFGSGSGGGTGLANIRARLGSHYGDRASLALENNELGGATATIVLPLAGATR